MSSGRRWLGVVLGLAAAACSLERLRRDEAVRAETGLLAGSAVAAGGDSRGVLVALFHVGRGKPRLEGWDELTDLVRSFAFMVTAGERYAVVAFDDANGDRAWQAGEALAVVGGDRPLAAPARRVVSVGELRLAAGAAPPSGFDLDLRGEPVESGRNLPLALGDVTGLDDPRFDPERGQEAMWTGLAAARKAGFGIYFLEPYDPARVPVLLVHGIAGTPRDFRDVAASLDRTRFQAWVYHYPSGNRLAFTAELLGRGMSRLHDALGCGRMVLVAHSMGGLVARGAVNWLDGRPGGAGFVSTFVTFATPWLGHDAAAMGLKWIEAPVPSWIDMAPDSDYLRSLRRPLPPGVSYHLLFGFGGGRSLVMGEANDGVVTVASQLAAFAQEEAVRAWGYDLDHMAILSDPRPLGRLAAILSAGVRPH